MVQIKLLSQCRTVGQRLKLTLQVGLNTEKTVVSDTQIGVDLGKQLLIRVIGRPVGG